jgi:hypothetical protein
MRPGQPQQEKPNSNGKSIEPRNHQAHPTKVSHQNRSAHSSDHSAKTEEKLHKKIHPATENDFLTPDNKNDTWYRRKCTFHVYVDVGLPSDYPHMSGSFLEPVGCMRGLLDASSLVQLDD